MEASPARVLIPVNPDGQVEPPLTEKEVRDAFQSWAGNTRSVGPEHQSGVPRVESAAAPEAPHAQAGT